MEFNRPKGPVDGAGVVLSPLDEIQPGRSEWVLAEHGGLGGLSATDTTNAAKTEPKDPAGGSGKDSSSSSSSSDSSSSDSEEEKKKRKKEKRRRWGYHSTRCSLHI